MDVPITFRLMQGTSTSPATGSQTKPKSDFMAMAVAFTACCGVPPFNSTMVPAAIAVADPTSA